jgi:monoterpene epsilon-lactone hydrolase
VFTLPDRLVNNMALPLRRRLMGDVFGSAERLHAHVERRRRRPANPHPPRRLDREIGLNLIPRDGWPVYEAKPRDRPGGVSIFYLHGGAYVNEITRWHWFLIRQLVREVPARCIVPIYPLAPSATAAELVPRVAQLACELIAETGPERTVLIGDSAGGGMGVAASFWLRDQGLSQPSRMILISPFLDVTMSDRRQDGLASKDTMLRRPGLVEAGRLYAGSLELDDPRVSPIHGDFRGLPPITVFTGTHDLLDPDSQRLAVLAREAGVPVDLHEVHGAPHAFPALPTSHGGQARALIVETWIESLFTFAAPAPPAIDPPRTSAETAITDDTRTPRFVRIASLLPSA